MSDRDGSETPRKPTGRLPEIVSGCVECDDGEIVPGDGEAEVKCDSCGIEMRTKEYLRRATDD